MGFGTNIPGSGPNNGNIISYFFFVVVKCSISSIMRILFVNNSGLGHLGQSKGGARHISTRLINVLRRTRSAGLVPILEWNIAIGKA